MNNGLILWLILPLVILLAIIAPDSGFIELSSAIIALLIGMPFVYWLVRSKQYVSSSWVIKNLIVIIFIAFFTVTALSVNLILYQYHNSLVDLKKEESRSKKKDMDEKNEKFKQGLSENELDVINDVIKEGNLNDLF